MTAVRDWRPVQRQRAHEQVLAQIEARILDGRLRPGDRLPGERELAGQLGVGRASVREALRVLEALGVLSVGTGSGPGAGSVVGDGSTEALVNLVRLHLALGRAAPSQVNEMRTRLRSWAATESMRENTLLAALTRALGE